MAPSARWWSLVCDEIDRSVFSLENETKRSSSPWSHWYGWRHSVYTFNDWNRRKRFRFRSSSRRIRETKTFASFFDRITFRSFDEQDIFSKQLRSERNFLHTISTTTVASSLMESIGGIGGLIGLVVGIVLGVPVVVTIICLVICLVITCCARKKGGAVPVQYMQSSSQQQYSSPPYGYPPPGAYPPQSGYPPQQGGYPLQSGYPPQGGYGNQSAYPPNYGQPQRQTRQQRYE